MNYAYIRVSTDKQTAEHQKTMIESRSYKIDKWYRDEAVSGKISWKKRKIWQAVKSCGAGDKIIVAELSRIGRSLRDILEIVEICRSKGIVIVCIREGIELSDDNPISNLLVQIMGSLAELERNLISQRTKDAMANLKLNGVKLGRPVGTRLSKEQHRLYGKEQTIRDGLANGFSWSKIGKQLNVGHQTVINYYNRFMKETQ